MIERAEWIWLSGCEDQNAYVDFKKAFVSREGEPIEIELRVDGNYALYLNNHFLDSGQYPDYPQYKVYDRLDLTEWVQEGENELKIRVWWPGVDHFSYCVEHPMSIKDRLHRKIY